MFLINICYKKFIYQLNISILRKGWRKNKFTYVDDKEVELITMIIIKQSHRWELTNTNSNNECKVTIVAF